MVKRDLPAYVRRRRAKGRDYYYFERSGVRVRMKSDPGTADFAMEYARLLKGRPIAPTKRNFSHLIANYKASAKYQGLAINTKKSYSRALDYLRDKIGSMDPATMRRVHVIDMQSALSDKPTTANRRVGVLSAIMEHAIDIGWIASNPVAGITHLKGKRPPREPWPVEMIQAFRDEADPETRLIFELALGTGQRIGDVLAMQWAHVDGDGINVRQSKTKAEVWIPWTATLARVVATAPRRGLFIACQESGRPWTYNGAWNRITRIRKAIGAERWDIHSLRHTAASELAALGLSSEFIMAVTGHASSGMALHYAGKAAQRARAEKAQKGRK